MLLKEKARRRANNRCKEYYPNGKAAEFIKMVGSDNHFVNMFIGANSTSKTATGVNIMANIIYGPQNEYFEYPLFQKWPYIKKGRIISDPTTIKSKIIPEMQKWFPTNDAKKIPDAPYETAKEGKNYVSRVTTSTGWDIDIMSNEQDVKEFESVDLGFTWIDEPMPKDRFLATIARGRLGMIIFWTFTPLTYSAWIKDWMDANEGELADYVEAEMEDNCFVESTEYLTKNGWKTLEEAEIGDIAATVDLESLKINYQSVTNVIRRQYDGEVVHLYGGIKSTPEHRIVGRFDGKSKFEVREAKDLYRGVRMLAHAENGYEGELQQAPFPRFYLGDWAEFLGWYLSEGCANGVKGGKDKNFRVIISQNEGENRERIMELLVRMGFNVRERKGDLWFTDKEIHQHLLPLGSSENKFIPEYIFEYPQPVQERFYQAMIRGDGDGKSRYFTTSKRLADDMQRLLTLMGYRSSLQTQKQSQNGYSKGSKKVLYRVYRLKGQPVYVNRKPKPERYKGTVSCVSVPNGIITVRSKKGKPLIVGNCKVHGVRGIMEHSNIKRMSDSFPEDEREARVFGKFGHLIGRVHKGFKRKVHVIPPFPLDPKRFTTYKALDPHPRVPDHVLYLSVDNKGTKYITGEIISEGLVRELYERMKAFEEAMHFRMQDRIIDPSAYVDDQHRKEKSVGSQLFDLGETYIKGSKNLMAGVKRTNDAFNFTMREGKMVMAPELYIFNTCVVAIKQLDEYVWSEWKGSSKDEKQPSGRPKDVNDHQPENLHRLLLHEPTFVPYQPNVRSGHVSKSYEQELEDLDPYDKV